MPGDYFDGLLHIRSEGCNPFCVCSLISCIAISRFASLDVRWCFRFNIPSRANHVKGIMPGAFTLILFLTKFQLIMSRG